MAAIAATMYFMLMPSPCVIVLVKLEAGGLWPDDESLGSSSELETGPQLREIIPSSR